MTRSSAGCGARCHPWSPAPQLCLQHTQGLGQGFFQLGGKCILVSLFQKSVIGCCPESLLSGVMQYHFVIPVLRRSMEMPGCEWNPSSAAWGQGSTILLLSDFQPCRRGISRAVLCVWLCSQRRLVFTFPFCGPADGSSTLHLEGGFPHSPDVWSLPFDLTNASLSGSS